MALANPEENPAVTLCPICCEDDELVLLHACSHKSCKTCLTKWIEKEETSGPETASCPFCRVSLNGKDVYLIIGRQFKPREPATNKPSSEEIDELTLEWINSQTKLCPGCGYRIEKDDGCNHMECICGYEFCFGCGQSSCDCLRDGAGDFDNEGYYAIRNNDGEVMLDACIRRTAVREERENLSEYRQHQVEERWTCCDSVLHLSNGEWLFSPKHKSDSLKALYSGLNSDRFKALVQARESKRQRLNEEQWSRWDETRGSGCTSNGRWLFCSRASSRSVKMLGQQLCYEEVRAQRELRLENQMRETEAAFNVWRALNRREMVRVMRNARREELQREYLSRP
mmetsp:Transcript_13466/g.21458  ORF Transcript_13466/g.21458 Transcript_13466/m.21458 type:complete len:341 (+) Transcript_13466:59-1081(+)